MASSTVPAKPALGTRINAAHPLAQGLVAAWLMNEAGGGVLTDAVNGIRATQNGTISWRAGGLGPEYAAAANGNFRIDTASTAARLNLSRGLSVVAWVRPSGSGTARAIFSAGQSGYYLRLNTSNQVNILKSNIADVVSGATALTDSARVYQVAATISRAATATVRVYVDGRLDATTTTAQTFSAADTFRYIGSDSADAERMNGAIAALYIYARELSPTDIRELAARPFAAFDSGPDWRLWGSGAVSGNATGNVAGQSIAVTGGTVTATAPATTRAVIYWAEVEVPDAGGGGATGTVTAQTIPITGGTVTGSAGQQATATVTTQTIPITGAIVTGSAGTVIDATGTVSADTVPITGGSVTGQAGALGIVSADTIPITGSTVAGTFDNTVTGAVAEDNIPVSGGTVTATATQGATGIVSGDTIPITGGLILAIDGGSVTGTVTVGIVPVSGGVVTATAGQRVTGTVTAKTIPVMGALVQAVDDLTFYGEFAGRAKFVPAWDGAATFND